MEFDEDIAPLMQKMEVALERIHQQLFPLLSSLDEDILVSNYTVEEQARISLAAASTLLFLTFAHDKLLNRAKGANEDKQLMLKINRITEYIGKLREITSLDNKPRSGKEPAQSEGTAVSSGAVGNRKRGRGDDTVSDEDVKPVNDDKGDGGEVEEAGCVSADPYGDAILFKEVERKVGKRSTLVRNLLQHVKGGDGS